MRTEDVEYQDGDVRCVGYVAHDEKVNGKRPGVLVIHEAWGLRAHAKGRADRLAELGYVGFAADMFGDRRQIDELQPALDTIGGIAGNIEVLKSRAGAALQALRSHPDVDPDRIAAIGFCFGGRVVLELARQGTDLKAVASFHGDLGSVDRAKPGAVKAKVLVCTGADDPLVDAAAVQEFEDEMRQAKADWELVKLGGAVHSFTNVDARPELIPGAIAYNEAADKRSWAAMKQILAEAFGK